MSYNIFNKAHLPLKLALISGCTVLSTNNFVNANCGSHSIWKIEEVLGVFKEQQHFEVAHIFPLIFEYEPSIWALFTSEHHKANNLSRQLELLIQTYKQASTANERSEVGLKIEQVYNQFVSFNFSHMDDEEPVLNEILWRYYREDVIKQIVSTLSKPIEQPMEQPKDQLHIVANAA